MLQIKQSQIGLLPCYSVYLEHYERDFSLPAPPFPKPKISFRNHWYSPQDFSDEPFMGQVVLAETGWGCLIYGYAASGKFPIFMDDNVTKLKVDNAYYDALSLAMGIYTINVKHDDVCTRLICNCKVH